MKKKFNDAQTLIIILVQEGLSNNFKSFSKMKNNVDLTICAWCFGLTGTT